MSYQRTSSVCIAITFIGALLFAGGAPANDLPGVNLGLTSFLDGTLPSGPGLYYQNYVEFYTAGRFENATGARLPLSKQDLTLWADINQFTYYFTHTIGPGRLAFDLVIPSVLSANANDGLGGTVLRGQAGIGDILFGPIYEFNPVSLGGDRAIHQSLELDILAPTGRYDPHLAVNPGNNFWALNPFYSLTAFVTQRLTFSGRFHYLYNFSNKDPNLSLGSGVNKSQAGEAFHVNIAMAYAITPKFGLGLNGYYLKQFTDTKINGISVSGRNERVLGIGPGVIYQFSKDTFLFLNAYAETLVQNRTEGSRFLLRVVHHL